MADDMKKMDPTEKNGLGDPIPSRNQNVNDDPTLRRSGGQIVDNDEDTMTAGERGHVSIQDLWLFEKHAHFNREVIPERRMHAKGWGAWGEFTVTHDISKYTRAKLFSKVGNKCKMFTRMSTVAGERGAADAERDIRGFALRFYTEEGNWDIVGNNTPVFFFRDPMKFIDLNHAVKRDPKSHLRSPNTNFDYWSSLPESLLQTTIINSDRGIPSSFRYMHGFGSHTYSMYNEDGERVWVKFHFRSEQGIQNYTDQEAEKVNGKDRESSGRDLYEAIEKGMYPKWKMYIQVMTEEEAKNHPTNPFDLTKMWLKKDYPLIPVGEYVLNKYPDNFFQDVEQAAFSPANIIPGIGLSPDRVLQARAFMYSDAQRYRLGVNHHQIPVNSPQGVKNPHDFHRDGAMRVDGNKGSELHYRPNSYGAWQDDPSLERPADEGGEVKRYDFRKDDNDYFTQPGMLFNRMTDEQKLVLFENTARNMGDSTMQIKHRYIRNCYLADPAYGKGVAEALGIDIESVNVDVTPPKSRKEWEEYVAMDSDLNYPTEAIEPESAKDLGPAGRDTNVANPKTLSSWEDDPYLL
ncbi:Catalase [Anaerococcus prevotii]|uniref:Catalase n=2 Tax=Anaerococcus prevotii TaxID=33034 RepID=C7RGI1_ANAPD|nr:catalase [Anaerococcus prevotii]ACV28592.1 Catalase [Anaerococcus prevotii DSM 20548]SUU94151.1 Catalase [Anaerococcus prevotii]